MTGTGAVMHQPTPLLVALVFYKDAGPSSGCCTSNPDLSLFPRKTMEDDKRPWGPCTHVEPLGEAVAPSFRPTQF